MYAETGNGGTLTKAEKELETRKKDDLEKVRAGLVTPDVPQVPAQTEVA